MSEGYVPFQQLTREQRGNIHPVGNFGSPTVAEQAVESFAKYNLTTMFRVRGGEWCVAILPTQEQKKRIKERLEHGRNQANRSLS